MKLFNEFLYAVTPRVLQFFSSVLGILGSVLCIFGPRLQVATHVCSLPLDLLYALGQECTTFGPTSKVVPKNYIYYKGDLGHA
jgi:hypothetical protein